jgi:hypothetical protein
MRISLKEGYEPPNEIGWGTMGQVEGKVPIATGGAFGIGAVCTTTLARGSAAVVVTAWTMRAPGADGQDRRRGNPRP